VNSRDVADRLPGTALGVPVTVAATLVAGLQAAGMIEAAPVQ